ncbi:MAG: MtrB/PioB family decaheme-associated outer membrane protein, partial [Gammaproteobacteria bacterium]|nr:MtrB/PioB family decaheme-associated outer membrane protein [Gammaproteobacteria bacterium]
MNRQSITLFAAVLVSLPIVAAGQNAPDTSDWECEFCTFPGGLYFDIDAGAGYVTDDAYRFGDYRGFDDDHTIFIGSFDMDYWTNGGSYWEATGRDLGLDSRSLLLQGGHQGFYNIELLYSNLPRQLFDTTLTPFSGFDTLSLPSAWVSSGSTALMTELDSSLMPVKIGHDRETLGFGLTYHPSQRLQYQIDYRHDERDGNRIRGASFLTQSALLPEPIDYSTDLIDASVSYAGSRGQLAVNYYASLFNSRVPALTWDNPFGPIVPGATSGRIALPPDNQAHQVSLSGAYRLSDATRFSATIATGSLKQDEPFVPYTINPTLAGTSLPAANLGGKVKTKKYNVRLNSRLVPQFRVQAELDVDDRDNQTPRNDYATVESDVFASGLRTNVPYSFQRTRLSFKGDYRVDRAITL